MNKINVSEQDKSIERRLYHKQNGTKTTLDDFLAQQKENKK